MDADDFDLDQLARYLHVTPQQALRLVERGQAPGRKVGGQWRFSPNEIHHWLEERIGVSGEAELTALEGMVDRFHAATAAERLTIAELLKPEAVAVPLAARTQGSVIAEMCRLAAGTGLLWDPDAMAEAVRAREKLHPTALDIGVALLHPRRPQNNLLAEPLLALGRTDSGIPFGGRSPPTDVFFLICSSDEAGHLRTLARLSRLIADPAVLGEIRAAESAAAARQALVAAEARLGEAA